MSICLANERDNPPPPPSRAARCGITWRLWPTSNFAFVSCAGPRFNPDSFVRHDQLGFIGADRAYAASMNLPVPVGMFMPQMPPQFQNVTMGTLSFTSFAVVTRVFQINIQTKGLHRHHTGYFWPREAVSRTCRPGRWRGQGLQDWGGLVESCVCCPCRGDPPPQTQHDLIM